MTISCCASVRDGLIAVVAAVNGEWVMVVLVVDEGRHGDLPCRVVPWRRVVCLPFSVVLLGVLQLL